MYFILGHSGGSRTTFIRGIVGWGAAVRAAIKLDGSKNFGSALDQERSELAERIQIDLADIGERGGDFKLLAQPFSWLRRPNLRFIWIMSAA
jgi:ABC-type ATPase involved in cell division